MLSSLNAADYVGTSMTTSLGYGFNESTQQYSILWNACARQEN